jgi:hypothetical protein
VFSGLDAKTEERIFHNLFGANGLLKERDTTVILATNAGRWFLPLTDTFF